MGKLGQLAAAAGLALGAANMEGCSGEEKTPAQLAIEEEEEQLAAKKEVVNADAEVQKAQEAAKKAREAAKAAGVDVPAEATTAAKKADKEPGMGEAVGRGLGETVGGALGGTIAGLAEGIGTAASRTLGWTEKTFARDTPETLRAKFKEADAARATAKDTAPSWGITAESVQRKSPKTSAEPPQE